MKVGLFINTQFPEGFNLAERVPEMVAQVRAARDAGFASLWFPHHWLTYPMQMLQIMPVMGYVASHAQGMTIGPNILILPPLNPMHVAEEAATLDVLTGGNYILGVGLGYRQPEFDAFGISLSERAPRFNESIALMRRLWTEERVSHKGRFYTVNDAGIGVKPIRPGGPPLDMAGKADVSVRRAARIGDAWLIVNTSGLGKVTALMQTYRAALKEYGRTPMEFPITVECYVGARHATAHEECRGPLEYKYNAYASWGLENRSTQGSFEDFARDRFIIGDKASVKEEIARYRELLGVDHFIMRCQWPGLPQQQVLSSIQRLGENFSVLGVFWPWVSGGLAPAGRKARSRSAHGRWLFPSRVPRGRHRLRPGERRAMGSAADGRCAGRHSGPRRSGNNPRRCRCVRPGAARAAHRYSPAR